MTANWGPNRTLHVTPPLDMDELNLARIEARALEWMRAGRLLYKEHARGTTSVDPADIITRAEEGQ